jgi:ketosteroid isomerase-like protein
MSTTSGQLDLEALRDAMVANDAAAVAAFYAPDAEIVMFDKDHPPSAPQRIAGAEAIRALYDDVCGRALRHEITAMVSGPTAAALSETCRYPDGVQVALAMTMTVRDGKIVHQEGVQAWDE